jgi:IclR family acetate operon transcriptional repressor
MSSSARRALKVLELVAASNHPMGVTEIARLLGQPAGTVFRTLDALQKSSYANRYLHSSRYVLGPSGLRLRHSLFAQFKIREATLPFLRQAASSTGETATLIVPLGWYGLRVASARGSNEVTSAPSLGTVGPLGMHYGGRTILAHLPDATIEAYLTWSARSGENSSAATLAEIRNRGFDEEEGALAVPICGGGEAIAALAVEGPVYRSGAKGRMLIEQCRAITRAIETMVAARPEHFINPFAHLPPEDVELGPRARTPDERKRATARRVR